MTAQSDHTIDPLQFAGKWSLDASRSSVSFRASSLWGLMKVQGRFMGLRGEAQVESNGSTRGQLVIDASSVDTGNTKPDRHLRSDDFFAVATYPEIVFELSRVVPGQEQCNLIGTLDVIGNTERLDLVARIQDRDASGITLQAETRVDRSRWDVVWRKHGMVNMTTALEICARFDRWNPARSSEELGQYPERRAWSR